MFGFGKRKRPADVELKAQIKAQTNKCVEEIKARWNYYNEVLPFRADVPLSEIIESFSFPIIEYVNKHYPLFAQNPDQGTHFWMMLLTAVMESKTHSIESVNAAALDLK